MKKRNNGLYFIFGVFAVVGVIFLILGIFLVFHQNISKENRVYTNAIIERIITDYDNDGDADYDVFISYEVDGEIKETKLNFYSSNYYEGKEIEIYYDINNPLNVSTESGAMMMFIFPLVGLIFFVIGLVGIIKVILKNKKIKDLKVTGREIYATFISTQLNTSYMINDQNPYNIICDWNDPVTNKKYIFKSENIWFNPESYIIENNIQVFKVYINPNNMNEYVVDTSNIENNVVDLTK